MEFERFVGYVKSCVESIGEEFNAPDDDWEPTLLVVAEREGEPGLFVAPLVGLPNKDVQAAMVRAVLKATDEPEMAALITSVWFRQMRPDPAYKEQLDAFRKEHGRLPETYAELGVTPPSEDVQSVEAVTIQVVKKGERLISMARIDRDGDRPPKLCDWEDWDQQPGDEMTGRFVEPFEEVFG